MLAWKRGKRATEFAGGELATTNNRMELQAAIEGLSRIKEPCDVELFTDSEYLREGITKWISAWKARGWKKKVTNKDLWHELDTAAARHKVIWALGARSFWQCGNERCDLLAMQEAERLKKSSTHEQANALAEFEKRTVSTSRSRRTSLTESRKRDATGTVIARQGRIEAGLIRDTTKVYARVHHKRLTFDKFRSS